MPGSKLAFHMNRVSGHGPGWQGTIGWPQQHRNSYFCLVFVPRARFRSNLETLGIYKLIFVKIGLKSMFL